MSIAECVPFTPGMCPCMPDVTVARHSTSFPFLVCTHNNIDFPLLSKECLLFPYEWYLVRLSYSVCSFPVMSFDVRGAMCDIQTTWSFLSKLESRSNANSLCCSVIPLFHIVFYQCYKADDTGLEICDDLSSPLPPP